MLKIPESKNRSLKYVAPTVDHQVTTGAAQRPVCNTGAVLDDHCVVQFHMSNMSKTKKQGEHWHGISFCMS